MRKLINDNAPHILGDKFDYVTAEEKEFYQLLRQKMHDDIDKIFDDKDKTRKVMMLSDLSSGIKELEIALKRSIGVVDFTSITEQRKESVGGYSKRIVAIDKGPVTKKDKSWVERWAKENEYPKLTIKQYGDDVIKAVGPGKDSWDNAIAWADLEEPYNNNFQELIAAIEGKPAKLEREEEKNNDADRMLRP